MYTKARYNEIEKQLKEIAKSLKNAVGNGADIDGIIEYELKKQKILLNEVKGSLRTVSGGTVNMIFPTVEQIKTAALFTPIVDNMTFQSYLDGIEAGFYNVWDSYVRTGYLTGQSTQQIVRNVLGTAAGNAKLADAGAIHSLRSSIYNNTRTVLQAFANETRNKVYEKNEKYFGDRDGYKYEYLSTLDSRTCAVCGSYDGNRYTSLKNAPKIPIHFSCRCLIIPAINIYEDERAAKEGPLNAKVTYADWLKEQSDDIQKEVLGITRYNLYKKGEPVTSFVSNNKILTLAELKQKGVLNIAGGILDKSNDEQLRFAKEYYASIKNRKSRNDINHISENTGFQPEKIESVRYHIFEDTAHKLSDGSEVKFSENPKIALAWQRLEAGKQNDLDIMFLNHEYTELTFMKKKGYSYEKAHSLANLRYPWQIRVEHEDWDVDKIQKAVRNAVKLYL